MSDQWAARSASGQVRATTDAAHAPANGADLPTGPRDRRPVGAHQATVAADDAGDADHQDDPRRQVGLPGVGSGGGHDQDPARRALD